MEEVKKCKLGFIINELRQLKQNKHFLYKEIEDYILERLDNTAKEPFLIYNDILYEIIEKYPKLKKYENEILEKFDSIVYGIGDYILDEINLFNVTLKEVLRLLCINFDEVRN